MARKRVTTALAWIAVLCPLVACLPSSGTGPYCPREGWELRAGSCQPTEARLAEVRDEVGGGGIYGFVELQNGSCYGSGSAWGGGAGSGGCDARPAVGHELVLHAAPPPTCGESGECVPAPCDTPPIEARELLPFLTADDGTFELAVAPGEYCVLYGSDARWPDPWRRVAVPEGEVAIVKLALLEAY